MDQESEAVEQTQDSGTEMVAEEVENPLLPPEPEQATQEASEPWRPAVSEMVAGMSSSLREEFAKELRARFDELKNHFSQNQNVARTPRVQQDPDLMKYDDPVFWAQNNADPKFLKYLQSKIGSSNAQMAAMQHKLSTMEQTWERRTYEDKLRNHLEAQASKAIKEAGISDKVKPYFEQALFTQLSTSGGDPFKADIVGFAKKFAADLDGHTKDVMAKQSEAAKAQQNKPSLPGKGTPTKPGNPKVRIKSMDDPNVKAGLDALVKRHMGED